MRRKWMYLACLLAGTAAWNGTTACAQTDIAASLEGALGAQQASNSVGVLLEVRHIHSSLVGFEGAYSYNWANQADSYTFPANAPTPLCPTSGCNTQPDVVSANAQAITGDWVVSRTMHHFRPFALAGGGVLFSVPSSSQPYTSTATEFVFVCGIGLDWEIASHFGLRLQDRANIYSAPNLNTYAASTGDLTYTQEPALGVYYRF